MDNLIKISSKQGSFDTTGNKSLVDFEISGNSGVYDLSRSYINVNVKPNADSQQNTGAIFNLALKLDLDSTVKNYVYPTAALVKNASMFSQMKGKVEDLRKVDSLRTNLSVYEKNQGELANQLGGLSALDMDHTFNTQPSAQLQRIGSEPSRNVGHDIRIPLSSVFNVAQTDSWDTARLGNTKIHLEMNFDKLSTELTETEATWANATDYLGVPYNYMAVESLSNTVLVTTAIYEDDEDIPWYVNMPVTIGGTTGTTAGGQGASAAFPQMDDLIVESIVRNPNNTLTLTFTGAGAGVASQGILAGGLPAGDSLYNCIVNFEQKIYPANPLGIVGNVVINSVELVAHINDSGSAPPLISYTTFLSEEESYPAQNTINKYYAIEPACKSVLLAFTAFGAVSRDLLNKYRLTLDGHEITTRAVVRGGSIHQDLVSKTFLNRGQRFHSINEKIFTTDAGITNGNSGGSDCFMIMIPVPFKNQIQRLGIELEADSGEVLGGQHILYKEVARQI